MTCRGGAGAARPLELTDSFSKNLWIVLNYFPEMSEHEHQLLESGGERPLVLALLLTLAMMVVEFAGGYLSGSLALVSDAGHMFTDSGALILSLLASHFAKQPSTPNKTFGFYRLEILAALLNGSILLVLAIVIFFEAFKRLLHPGSVGAGLMLVVASIGLAVNILSALILMSGSSKNLNVRGAFLHVLSDAASSIGVIIGGLLIVLFRFYIADPVIGCLIGLLILKGGYNLMMEAVEILLESTPPDIDINDIAEAIKKKIPAIKSVHDVHVWTITSGLRALSAHIELDDRSLSECAAVSDQVKEMMEKDFHIGHTTLEFECENCGEGR